MPPGISELITAYPTSSVFYRFITLIICDTFIYANLYVNSIAGKANLIDYCILSYRCPGLFII